MKYFYILLFVCFSGFSQSIYQKKADNLLHNMDLSNLETDILYDRVYPTANLIELNPEESLIDSDWYKQVYEELANSDYQNRGLKINTFTEKISNNTTVVPIGIINSEFEYINKSSPGNINSLTDKNGKLKKVTKNIKPKFLKKEICIISPLLKAHEGLNVTFQLKEELSFINAKNQIESIQANFNDNKGLRTLDTEKNILVSYSSTGVKTIDFKVFYKDGRISERQSSIEIKAENTALTITSSTAYQGYDEAQAYKGQGEYEIFLDTIDNLLDKPIILIDGFDPGDNKGVADIYNLLNFDSQNLADILRAEGYDVVILNFPKYTQSGKEIDGGSDYIQRNALVLTELIAEINNQKTGDEELVIIGPSMGGLIARYALATMEKNSVDHHTRLFISFDAPHTGANLPISMQYFVNYFYFTAGGNALQGAISAINSPAAKEMILDHYLGHITPGTDYKQDSTLLLPVGAPDFREVFQKELDDLGFPKNVRNIAITNGSGKSTMIGDPSATIIDEKKLTHSLLYDVDVSLKFAPQANQTIVVCDLFLDGWFNDYEDTYKSQSFDYTDGLDSTPGGTASIKEALGASDQSFATQLKNAVKQDDFSFIPTLSALAINNEKNWYATPNIGDSPFANTYSPDTNEKHVTLSKENTDFALHEIRNHTLDIDEKGIVVNNKYFLIKNPVSEEVKIKLNPSLNYSNVQISIANVSGQQVFYKKIQNQGSLISINPSFPSNGMYILNLTDSEGSYREKIMVKK